MGSEYFTLLDWVVVFGYLLLTTLVGHFLSGKQSSIKDFFLAGRSLPWPAVTGSIIATEISGVTFIGVPGMVYAANGNFTYLQWGIGSIIARVLVGLFFVKAFYEREIYSPYDYMGNRLEPRVKKMATILFQIGGILGQSVRVLVAALALKVVTQLEFHHCIWIIGVFAIGWTLMGGMQTVIWTDVMQFFLFVGAALFSLAWMLNGISGGWSELMAVSGEANKLTLLNLSRDPAAGFTLWVAIIAVPFQNLSMFGVDQLNAQRMFCCRNEKDARKAIIASSAALLITALMLMVGAAMYTYYHQIHVPESLATFQSHIDSLEPNQRKDAYYPVWIVTELPQGLRALILAGIFAAAISSLDSILAALSQTSFSLLRNPESKKPFLPNLSEIQLSRLLVIVWGVGLSAFALLINMVKEDINIVELAFGMTSYTVGPMLGFFLAAFFTNKATFRGLALGFALSFILVLLIRTDFWNLLILLELLPPHQIANFTLLKLITSDIVGETDRLGVIIHSAWAWPVTALLTWGCGYALRDKSEA